MDIQELRALALKHASEDSRVEGGSVFHEVGAQTHIVLTRAHAYLSFLLGAPEPKPERVPAQKKKPARHK